jgi:chromosome segregation ATPase
MNGFLGGSQGRGALGATLEKQLKNYEDMFNERAPHIDGVSSDDFFRQISKENSELKIQSNELQQQVELLRHKMTELKAQPVRLENSPDQSARVIRLESDKKRLMMQLAERTEKLEELKLRLQDRPEGENLGLHIEAIRKEVTAQIKEQFDTETRRIEQSLHAKDNELSELKLKLDSKEKENRLLEETISSIELRTLEDAENMRQTLVQSMWEQYEKKLLARKNEFESKCQNYLNEQERLSKSIREWRKKCIELEEKNASLYSQMNSSKEDDMDLKRMVTDYDGQVNNLRISLERAQQVNSELEQQSDNFKNKIYSLESMISSYQEREASSDDRILELEAKTKALFKELDRSKNEASIWKQQLEKAESTNSRFKLNLLELENHIKNNDKFKSSNTKELLWERSNTERLHIEVQQMETELKTAIAARDAFKEQLERTKEEVLVKNSLIEDFKKSNYKSQDIQDQFLKELGMVKAELARTTEEGKVLANHLSRITSERNDLQFRIEADKLKNSRPEKSALSMLNKTREVTNVEVKILEEKLNESHLEARELKTKLGQFVNEWKPKANELARQNEILENQVQSLKNQLEITRTELNNQGKHIPSVNDPSKTLSLRNPNENPQENPNSQGQGTAQFGSMPHSQDVSSELAKIKSDYDALRRQYDSSNSTKNQLSNEKAAAELEIKRLSQQIEELKNPLTSQPRDQGRHTESFESTDALKKELYSLKDENTRCKQRLEDLNSQLRMSENNYNIVTRQCEDLKKDRDSLLYNKTELERENKSLNTAIVNLERQNQGESSSQHILREKDDEISRLIHRIDSLNQEATSREHHIGKLLEEIGRLELNLNQGSHHQGGQIQIPTGAGRNSQAEGQGQGNLRGSGVDNFGVNEATMAFGHQIEQLEEANQQLAGQLDMKDRIIQELQRNLEGAHGDLGVQNAQLRTEVEELQYVKAISERLGKECDDLRVDIKNLLDERAYIINENNVLHQDNIELASRVDELTKQKPGQLQLRNNQDSGAAREYELKQKVNDLTSANNNLISEIQMLEAKVYLF